MAHYDDDFERQRARNETKAISGKIEISRELAERIMSALFQRGFEWGSDDPEPELRALLASSQCSEVVPQCSEQLRTQAAPVVEPLVVHLSGPKEWLDSHRAAPVVERQEPAAWLNVSTGHITTCAVTVMDWDDENEQVQSLYTSPPAPGAVVTREQVEIVAESIYLQWEGREGFVPWVKGGNSLKQDEARSIAWKTLDKVKELNQ